MPVEVRQIWFDTAEVDQALRLFPPNVGSSLPQGDVLSAKEEHGADGPITITTEVAAVTLERAKVAAALILFCKKNRIPLPAAAKKMVVVDGERLVLRVALSGIPRRPAAAAPTPWARHLTKADL